MPRKCLIICGGSGTDLIGLRDEIGIDCVMQIDVSKELDTKSENTKSLRVPLDFKLISTAEVAVWLKETYASYPAGPEKVHADFIADYYPYNDLMTEGAGKSPAIGGAVLRDTDTTNNLIAKLGDLIKVSAADGDNAHMDVWFVASTAGGAGAGVCRFVAKKLAELHRTSGITTKFIFMRPGPYVYKSVDPEQTQLNTFFSIAADAAFQLRMSDEHHAIPTYWYYFDLPDCGIGPAGRKKSRRLIAQTIKPVMQGDLNAQLAAFQNGGPPRAIIRSGYWSVGLEEKDDKKYTDSLSALKKKLDKFRQLEYVQSSTNVTYRCPVNDDLKTELKKVDLGAKYKDHWKLQKINNNNVETMLQLWKEDLKKLAASGYWERMVRHVESEFRVIIGQDEFAFAIHIGSLTTFSKDWCLDMPQKVRNLQCAQKILKDLTDEIWLNGERISKNFLWGANTKTLIANVVHQDLFDLMFALAKVEYLTGIVKVYEPYIREELPKIEVIGDDLPKEKTSNNESLLIEVAELHDQFVIGDITKTWIEWINDALKNLNTLRENTLREIVLMGAIGLTRAGLFKALGLSSGDPNQIKNTLANSGNATGSKAIWWQDSNLVIYHKYMYRFFPKLDPITRSSIGEEDATNSINYVHPSPNSKLGLDITTLEVANCDSNNTVLGTPVACLKPLVPVVRQLLASFLPPLSKQSPTNQTLIAKAGVIGDPLHREVLVQAGLTASEITALEKFYIMV